MFTLMRALVEYADDVLVNECQRPAADRALLYHGTMPHDCCTANGVLAINWQSMFNSTRFPASSATDPSPCDGHPVAELRLRYVVCWPAPPSDASGKPTFTEAFYEECNATAGMLADVAECMQRELRALACAIDSHSADDDELTAAVRAAIAGKRLRFIATEPIVPGGMCAGVQWRLYAAPSPGAPAS